MITQQGKLFAEPALRIDEYPDERYKQQGVTTVGYGDAPWIVIQRQDTTLHICIVVHLIQADIPITGNLIHWDGKGLAIDGNLRDIVGWHLCPLIELYVKMLQTDVERQLVEVHVAC